MAQGYSDAVIDQLFEELKILTREYRSGREIDIYWALDIIRILDRQPRIFHRGEFSYCRRHILRAAREYTVVPMFNLR